jgi:hypothetical protein
MIKKLIRERISRTEEKPFLKSDVELLKSKRNKQFLILLSGYLPFIAFGVYILFMGPDSLNTGRHNDPRPYMKINIDDEEKSRFWTVAPYFLGFMFIMLNIYFTKLYFQSLRPLLKDIKFNKKQLLFFKPEKNPMALFNKYYVSSPLYKYQEIQVNEDDFNGITEYNELCLEIGPNSVFVLRLLNGNKELPILNNSD